MKEDIAKRSINSVKWNFLSNIIYNIVYFFQTIILARLLPVEAFGIYAGAASIVVITSGFATFGMTDAFLHRSKETEDYEKTVAVLFTLQLILNLIWTVLMISGGLLFINRTEPDMLIAFIVLTITYTIKNTTNTPVTILTRQIQYKRLALVTLFDTGLTFISAIVFALLHQSIWALLATNISQAVLYFIFFYIWKPFWRPKLSWDIKIVKYFFQFGSLQLINFFLLNILDRGDDYWTKTYLGSTQLGYYSRAYAIAKIPTNIIASPISNVAFSAFAELKDDKEGLSEVFFLTSSLLIHTGFFIAGVLLLVAPEFICIVLSEKWLPMLLTFRLMLPFVMFDPLKQMMASLFVAIGKPDTLVKIRLIQVISLFVLLSIFGMQYGIEGVAISVDIMMLVGIGLILFNAKDYISLHIREMFLIPMISLFISMFAGYEIMSLNILPDNDWISGITKTVVFSVVFILILVIFEKERILQLIRFIRKNKSEAIN